MHCVPRDTTHKAQEVCTPVECQHRIVMEKSWHSETAQLSDYSSERGGVGVGRWAPCMNRFPHRHHFISVNQIGSRTKQVVC